MEYYNNEISKNSDVELVWYPKEKEKAATTWAAEEKFPWPVIREKALEKVEAISKHHKGGVPSYFLVDAEGKLVVTGLSAAKRHIQSLEKG